MGHWWVQTHVQIYVKLQNAISILYLLKKYSLKYFRRFYLLLCELSYFVMFFVIIFQGNLF